MSEYIDIENRSKDYQSISDETFRTELGLRAISLMYDDHSDDKKSYENILKLKDNIHYRLFSATHQYLVFLRELTASESHLKDIYKEKIEMHYFYGGNPHYEKIEQELSSIFDNIVFQISSVFDYLSHIICYVTYRNKSNTVYWTKLAKSARAKGNELANTEIAKAIDKVDNRFVKRLYDYRSRLLHNQRDKHKFEETIIINDILKVRVTPSDIALKHFKLIDTESQGSQMSLTFLSSWLLKRSFIEIEELLDSLELDLKKNSHFYANLAQPKQKNGIFLLSLNSDTNFGEPHSETMWREYKKNSFLKTSSNSSR